MRNSLFLRSPSGRDDLAFSAYAEHTTIVENIINALCSSNSGEINFNYELSVSDMEYISEQVKRRTGRDIEWNY